MSKLYYKDVQYIPTVAQIKDSATESTSMWSSSKTSSSIVKPTKGTDYYLSADEEVFAKVDCQARIVAYLRGGSWKE